MTASENLIRDTVFVSQHYVDFNQSFMIYKQYI